MSALHYITRHGLALFLVFSAALTVIGQTAPVITGPSVSLNIRDGDLAELVAQDGGSVTSYAASLSFTSSGGCYFSASQF